MTTPAQSRRYAYLANNLNKQDFIAYYAHLLEGGRVEDFFDKMEKHQEHDQSTHGSWADGVSSTVVEDIQRFTREWGGLSISMVDGSMPDKGFMVAKPPEFSHVVDEADFFDPIKGPKILAEYMKKNRADLGRGGKDYLGTWLNGGKVYLDVSQNMMNREESIRVGRERNQKAIWDVVNQVEIDTGGTGEVQKGNQGGSTSRHLADDGRGNRPVRSENLGEVGKAYKVIRFEPGLIPLFKHQEHDQSTHGNWALSENYPDLLTLGTFDEESEYDSALAVYSERYGVDSEGNKVGVEYFEHDAIDTYSQEGYRDINAFLRNPSDFDDEYSIKFLEQKVDGLDSLIEKAPDMFGNTTLFRVVDDLVLGQLSEGDILREKGFLSTTRIDISRDTELRDYLGGMSETPDTVAVILPSPSKSGKGIAVDLYRTSVDDTSGVSDREKEVLLPRNTDLLFLGYRTGIGSENGVAVFQRVDK